MKRLASDLPGVAVAVAHESAHLIGRLTDDALGVNRSQGWRSAPGCLVVQVAVQEHRSDIEPNSSAKSLSPPQLT